MTSTTPQEHVDDSLLRAVVHSSNAPLILLNGDLIVIVASDSFSHAFALEPRSVEGMKLTALGDGEWNLPQLESLLLATARDYARIEAYEMELKFQGRPSRQLLINALKLDYGNIAETRLLVTVMDVTEARIAAKLKDDLLREKAILLQELQHRVANSLQIVASVLLQSARRTKSEETRADLHDAHRRIMSVATLQQQLAASRLGNVELRSYFTDLCRSIGASMIRDHKQIALDVSVDGSEITADVSISLGLIVTELVINALKHAFPGGRVGWIKVGYNSHGTEWQLSVSDNGVGIRPGEEPPKAGLGTNIVAALAASLDAEVQTSATNPGVRVAIIHPPAAKPHPRRGLIRASFFREGEGLSTTVSPRKGSEHLSPCFPA